MFYDSFMKIFTTNKKKTGCSVTLTKQPVFGPFSNKNVKQTLSHYTSPIHSGK